MYPIDSGLVQGEDRLTFSAEIFCDIFNSHVSIMICAINIIKAQIIIKNIKITTHSQWENAEDSDLSDFIQFIPLERFDFLKTVY